MPSPSTLRPVPLRNRCAVAPRQCRRPVANTPRPGAHTHRLFNGLLAAVLVAGSPACKVNETMVNDDRGVNVGAPDPRAHAAVGVLRGGGGVCTASLIAADVLLTAAHCVHFVDGDLVHWQFTLGSRKVATRSARSLTSGRPIRRRWVADDPSRDIAFVRLAESVADIAPLRLEARAPTPSERVELVGAGCRNHESKLGTIAVATGLWKDVRDGDVVCDGDSGGPLLRRNRGVRTIVGLAVGYSRDNSVSPPIRHPSTYARIDPATLASARAFLGDGHHK